MATTSANYSLTVGVNILKGDAQKAIDAAFKDVKIPSLKFDDKSINTTTDSTSQLGNKVKETTEAVKDMELSFNVANEVFQTAKDIIGDLTQEVFTLNSSMTEFRKVSELSGNGLDAYVEKLTELGKQVGRTGKPNRSEPVCCDGKAA